MTPTGGGGHSLSLEEPPFRGASGRGVRVAIIDSGVAAGHPHVGGVVHGVHILPDGEDDDFADRLGHGTAVAGAIREKAADAELLAVRVFDQELTTTASVLARAIEWAAEHGAHVINVSMGTTNAAHADRLDRAVQLAADAGALVVAAASSGGRPVWPGCLPVAVGVEPSWEAPRDVVAVEDAPNGGLLLRASGFPRPIPGIPPERNLQGVSFAVANAAGFLARWRESHLTAEGASIAILRASLVYA